MTISLERIPEYMMPFLINGTTDNYTEEDISNAIEWLNESGVKEVIRPCDENYEPYFSWYPSFGEPCDVVDCECILEY